MPGAAAAAAETVTPSVAVPFAGTVTNAESSVMSKLAIVAALAIGTVVAFGIFDVIYVLVGTDRDARSVMMQIYLTTFGNLDFGHGAALAVLLSLASILISCLYIARARGRSS